MILLGKKQGKKRKRDDSSAHVKEKKERKKSDKPAKAKPKKDADAGSTTRKTKATNGNGASKRSKKSQAMVESEDEGEAEADAEDEVEDDADAGPSTKSSKKAAAAGDKTAASPPPAKKAKRDRDDDADEGKSAFSLLSFVVLRTWCFVVQWSGSSDRSDLLLLLVLHFLVVAIIALIAPLFLSSSSFNAPDPFSAVFPLSESYVFPAPPFLEVFHPYHRIASRNSPFASSFHAPDFVQCPLMFLPFPYIFLFSSAHLSRLTFLFSVVTHLLLSLFFLHSFHLIAAFALQKHFPHPFLLFLASGVVPCPSLNFHLLLPPFFVFLTPFLLLMSYHLLQGAGAF